MLGSLNMAQLPGVVQQVCILVPECSVDFVFSPQSGFLVMNVDIFCAYVYSKITVIFDS